MPGFQAQRQAGILVHLSDFWPMGVAFLVSLRIIVLFVKDVLLGRGKPAAGY